MGSKVGNLVKAAAPIALGLAAPGIGTALGTALGAGSAFAPAIGGAALGGGLGALTGGGKLSNILTGAATGGIGGYAGSGQLGSALSGTGIGNALEGTAIGNGLGIGQQAAFDKIISTPITTAAGGGASSFGGGSSNLLSNVLSAGLGTAANDSAEEDLLRAQGKAAGAIEPFANTSFKPEDLQNDPGYQFQLSQGEQALGRQQAAKGNYFSGQALKAAQDYGQGLAGTTYNAANQRFNDNRGFNYGVAQDQAALYGNEGNIKAQSGINQNNLLSGSLAGILGGNGISNSGQSLNRKVLGYDQRTGQPIYG